MAYTTTTRAALRAALQVRYTGDPFWSAQEANDAINESLRQFNLFTGYWRGTVSAVTTANVAFVSLPGTLTRTSRVYRSGRALTRKSIVELYRSRRNWRTETTASGGTTPATVREWAPVGLSQIAIWPTDAAGGTVLTFDAVKVTPVLLADGAVLDLGQEELTLILAEALYILSFKMPSILEPMAEQHQMFMAGCGERNDQIRASAFYRRALGLDQEQRLEPIRVMAEVPDAR